MISDRWTTRPVAVDAPLLGAIAMACLSIMLLGSARASVDFRILPEQMVQEPGDTVTVELTVVNESSDFNGYDARVSFDPDRLTFLQLDPVSLQEGPLMTEACSNRFHIFTIGADSAYVEINHVLLCAGVSVTGPGVVYRLRFVCGEIDGPTELNFTDFTQFYDAGIIVSPVELTGAVIEIDALLAAPDASSGELELAAAPNPFNPRTSLSFTLPAAGPTRLVIHDSRGARIRTLVDEVLPAGTQRRIWDARDDSGRSVASGIYFLRLETLDRAQTLRVTVLK